MPFILPNSKPLLFLSLKKYINFFTVQVRPVHMNPGQLLKSGQVSDPGGKFASGYSTAKEPKG